MERGRVCRLGKRRAKMEKEREDGVPRGSPALLQGPSFVRNEAPPYRSPSSSLMRTCRRGRRFVEPFDRFLHVSPLRAPLLIPLSSSKFIASVIHLFSPLSSSIYFSPSFIIFSPIPFSFQFFFLDFFLLNLLLLLLLFGLDRCHGETNVVHAPRGGAGAWCWW